MKNQEKVKIVIKDVEKSGFSASSLNELSRVDFTVGCSDCVAWIGCTCEIVND